MLLIVTSNIFYNIATKETPENANSFLSLVFTYLVGAAVSLALYFITSANAGNIADDIKNLNWTGLVLGLCVVGLETGYIYLYRAGWQISVGSLVANIALAIALVIIGALLYHDVIGVKQIVGMILCAAGLFFINSN